MDKIAFFVQLNNFFSKKNIFRCDFFIHQQFMETICEIPLFSATKS